MKGQKDRAPVWSPNGQTIAFARQPDFKVARYSLCTIKPDGSGLTTVGQLPNFVSLIRWFPGGTRLLVSADALYAVDFPSLSAKRLDDPIAEGGLNLRDCYDDGSVRQYRWDDGVASVAAVAGTSDLLIAYEGSYRGEGVTDQYDVCVVSVTIDGTTGGLVGTDGKLAGPTAVLSLPGSQGSPALSLDGSSVVFTGAAGDGVPSLAVASITGIGSGLGFGEPRGLDIGAGAVGVYGPTWSPNMQSVAFGKMYMGTSSRILTIWRTPVDGGAAVELNPAPKAWQDDVEPD